MSIDHKVFMTALNGKTFLGMVRVDGPPEWASGEGRYVLEADYKALLDQEVVAWLGHGMLMATNRDLHDANDRNRALEKALRDLYEGTQEYIYLNRLGDPHNTTPMRNAAIALGLPVREVQP